MDADRDANVAAPGADSPESPSPAAGYHGVVWIIFHLEELVTAALLGVMIGSVGLGVFCRYLLQMPLSWTEEVVLICMVWMVFLGACVATKHNEHIVIDFVVSLVPRPVARAMEILAVLVVSVVLGVLTWQGILLLQGTQYVTTTALGIPTMYMYAAVPVAAALMFLHNLRHLVAAVRH